MSLLKLLAAGRSLIGTRAAQSPYRMRTENLLPKFDSPKNPFAAKTKAETQEETKPVKLATQPTAAAAAKPAKMETVSLFDSKPVAPASAAAAAVKVADAQPAVVEQRPKPEAPKISEAPKTQAPSRVVPAPKKKLAPVGEQLKKLNPLKLLRAQMESRKKSARATTARPVVQAELSLEKVKVVRNDLSDADLEIMPAKPVILPEPGGLSGAAGPMMSMTRTQPTSWNRLTSSVSGAIQTMIR